MDEFKRELKIYTDGACSTNGTWESGAAACYYLNDKPILKVGHYLGKATNNIAELKAIEMALMEIVTMPNCPKDIYIMSDSAYIVNCMNDGWYKKWEVNGWLTSQKKAVANKDIWESILLRYKTLSKYYNISFVKVKGHSSDKFNAEVDRVAVLCKDLKQNYRETQ